MIDVVLLAYYVFIKIKLIICPTLYNDALGGPVGYLTIVFTSLLSHCISGEIIWKIGQY